tara:strand:+ start:142 stop:1482 length:1341 start_codon:yes stop_codon:yes gene_type:complete
VAEGPGVDTNRLSALFDVEHRARSATDLTTLRFVIVNESRRVFGYAHAALIEPGAVGWKITAVSDVASADRNGLFAQWVERAFAQQKPADDTAFDLNSESLGDWERGVWDDVSPAHVHVVPLGAPGRAPAAWLWLAAEQPLDGGATSLAEHLAEVYGHALAALSPNTRRRSLWERLSKRRYWLGLAALVVLVLLLPVRLSALAPAEIVARDPAIVAAPLDGVVEDVLVAPNERVEAGQPLVALDDIEIRNQYQVASKQLEVARAQLEKTEQQAFNDAQSRAELATRRAEVGLREVQKAYAKQQLDRIVLKADRAGIAIYNDPDDWAGRPVQTGERIMQLAEPSRREVRIDLSVDDALLLSEDAPMKLFLDSHPLSPVAGRIVRVSYKPVVDDHDKLVYHVTARLTGERDWLRIGLRGTAKISGSRVPLVYYLLRRPIAALRQTIGY